MNKALPADYEIPPSDQVVAAVAMSDSGIATRAEAREMLDLPIEEEPRHIGPTAGPGFASFSKDDTPEEITRKIKLAFSPVQAALKALNHPDQPADEETDHG